MLTTNRKVPTFDFRDIWVPEGKDKGHSFPDKGVLAPPEIVQARFTSITTLAFEQNCCHQTHFMGSKYTKLCLQLCPISHKGTPSGIVGFKGAISRRGRNSRVERERGK